MECEDGQPIEDVDSDTPATLSFWQRIGPRVVMLVALVGPAAAVFLTQHWHSRSELIQTLRETRPPTGGYAIETTPMMTAAPEPTPATPAPITVDMIASPPRSVTDQPAALQLTTKPAGATFAVYSGIIANKTAPAFAPLRTGTSPGTAEELRGGNYTIFFHKDGWPDSRTEVQLQAGEVRPVEYAFPHGEVTITSVPNGAEILRGAASLGFTPLTVDLPAGEQALTARLKNYPDRTQNVTVNENATSTIEFQMRARRRIAKAKRTPPPSLIEKVSDRLKNLFGANPTPPPGRKR
jgi:PEGA domain-containing protein